MIRSDSNACRGDSSAAPAPRPPPALPRAPVTPGEPRPPARPWPFPLLPTNRSLAAGDTLRLPGDVRAGLQLGSESGVGGSCRWWACFGPAAAHPAVPGWAGAWCQRVSRCRGVGGTTTGTPTVDSDSPSTGSPCCPRFVPGGALLPEAPGRGGPLPAPSGPRRWAACWPRGPAARGGSVLACTGSCRAPGGRGSGPSSPAWGAVGAGGYWAGG